MEGTDQHTQYLQIRPRRKVRFQLLPAQPLNEKACRFLSERAHLNISLTRVGRYRERPIHRRGLDIRFRGDRCDRQNRRGLN